MDKKDLTPGRRRRWKRWLLAAMLLIGLPTLALFHQAHAAAQCRDAFWHCGADPDRPREKIKVCEGLTVRLKETLNCYLHYLTPNKGGFSGFASVGGNSPEAGNRNNMSSYQVNSTAELMTALSQASAGDVIQMAGGSYSGININGIKFPDTVSITSADPSNPAIFTDLRVNNSSGLAFSNITLEPVAGSGNYVFITSVSQNISFDHMVVRGQEGDAAYDQQPFLVRDSSGISVTNSEFTHVFNALNMWRNSDVTITDNYFHDIRCDAIRGSVISDITIQRNFFTDFHPRGPLGTSGDHPDAIQLWTDSLKGSTENVTITDNLFVRGEGSQVQGIFLRDTVGGMPFQNVTITNNTIVGGMYNGIAVMGGENVTITTNTVIGTADQQSWIRVTDVTGGKVADNTATSYMQTNVSQVSFSSNSKVSVSVDNAQEAIRNFLSAHPSMAEEALRLLEGQANDSSDAGNVAVPDDTQLGALPPPPPVEENIAPATPQFVLNGTDGADKLRALIDHDNHLDGGAGNDQLYGIAGATTHMAGGAGDDWYFVRDATDTVVEQADAGADRVYSAITYTLGDNVEELWLQNAGLTGTGNALDNRLVGSGGDETLWGLDGNDLMQGGAGNDTLWGGNGNDTLRGEDGNDLLYGEAGNDQLYGGDGDDYLNGGAGDDLLEGGAGFDRFFGGEGRDQFRFRDTDFTTASSVKQIMDFCATDGDVINLAMMDANSTLAGNQAFCFIDTRAFTSTAGELRYEMAAGAAHVLGDIDGDGKADFTLLLDNVTTLHATDFWL